jgi:hypothetical protein
MYSQDQHTAAAALQAIAQAPSMTALPFTLAALETGSGQSRHYVRRAWRFVRTCTHAAKLLPTVRRAIPWYVWPILAVAAVVKCFPLDFGTDEALFAVAFALIAWRRPGLLKALYREAQAGKPAPCGCRRHAPVVAASVAREAWSQ